MSSRWDGTQVGLSRAGQSERMQARKARVRRLRSSDALPSHNRLRLGHVHSRKHRAGTSSGVRADLALLAHHSFTITGGTAESYRNETHLDSFPSYFVAFFLTARGDTSINKSNTKQELIPWLDMWQFLIFFERLNTFYFNFLSGNLCTHPLLLI